MNWRSKDFDLSSAIRKVTVLILGGGINGAGLFRELALQGVDCLLVDKADFAAGASSKSSRMIHGGLRYLENREFKLVTESLLERNRLLDNAAHYVAPLKTTIPLFSWFGGLLKSALIFAGFKVAPGSRGVVPIKFGLWFYDFVTRKNPKTPKHFFTGKAESLQAPRPAWTPGIVATATYWDAWITQAERLCIELIQDALRANPRCRALNYVAACRRQEWRGLLKTEYRRTDGDGSTQNRRQRHGRVGGQDERDSWPQNALHGADERFALGRGQPATSPRPRRPDGLLPIRRRPRLHRLPVHGQSHHGLDGHPRG